MPLMSASMLWLRMPSRMGSFAVNVGFIEVLVVLDVVDVVLVDVVLVDEDED